MADRLEDWKAVLSAASLAPTTVERKADSMEQNKVYAMAWKMVALKAVNWDVKSVEKRADEWAVRLERNLAEMTAAQ